MPSPSCVQDVYYYAKANAVCPEGSYGYVSGGYGYSLTCQATACSSQGRIQITGNSKLKAAMTTSGYLSKWPSADFNPYVVYVAGYTDAFVKIQPSTNAIADASGRCCRHTAGAATYVRLRNTATLLTTSLILGPSCSQFIALHNLVSVDFTVFTDFFNCTLNAVGGWQLPAGARNDPITHCLCICRCWWHLCAAHQPSGWRPPGAAGW